MVNRGDMDPVGAELTALVFAKAAELVAQLATSQIDGRSLSRANVLSLLNTYISMELHESALPEIPS